MSCVWSEGFSKNNNFDKFECNFAYHQKMSGYALDLVNERIKNNQRILYKRV